MRAAQGVTLVLLGLLCCPGPCWAVRMVLVHGIFSDSTAWSGSAVEQYSRSLDTHPFEPSTHWKLAIPNQAAILRDALNSNNVQAATAVAFSMGAAVTRRFILDNPTQTNINTLITVSGVNAGAPVASNIYDAYHTIQPLLWGAAAAAMIDGLLTDPTADDVLAGRAFHQTYGSWTDNDGAWLAYALGAGVWLKATVDGISTPSMADLAPSSAVTQSINGDQGFESSVARASIVDQENDPELYYLCGSLVGPELGVDKGTFVRGVNSFEERCWSNGWLYGIRYLVALDAGVDDPTFLDTSAMFFAARAVVKTLPKKWRGIIGAPPDGSDAIVPLPNQTIPGINASYTFLVRGTNHHEAINSSGVVQAIASAASRLEACTNAMPPVAELIAPDDGTDVTCTPSLSLQWDACSALSCDVQIATDSTFTTLVQSTDNIPATGQRLALSVPSSLTAGATYFWRARGRNASGDGPWSASRRFGWHLPTATITGPTVLATGADRSWTISVSGGTVPYSYAWYDKGMDAPPFFAQWQLEPSITGPTFSGTPADVRSLPFWLRYVVRDACDNVTTRDICVSSDTESSAPLVTLNGPITVAATDPQPSWVASAQYGQVCGQYTYAWRWRVANTTSWSNVLSTGSTFSVPIQAPGIDVRCDVSGVQTTTAILHVDEQSGCPTVDIRVTGGWAVENTILGRSTTEAMALDSYRLRSQPDTSGGEVSLRIRENEQEQTTLDEVRLVAIDHKPDVRAFAVGERVVLGTHVPPARVTTSQGLDLTSALAGPGSSGYSGHVGDTLLVELSGVAMPGAGLMRTECCDQIDDGDGGKGGGTPQPTVFGVQPLTSKDVDSQVLENTGILFQVPDGAGGWRTAAHRYPREYFDEACYDSIDSSILRLVFLSDHKLWYVGSVEVSADGLLGEKLPLLAAQHSRFGDVTGSVSTLGNLTTSLIAGDTLIALFGWTPVPEGQVRDLFLLSNGVYTSNLPARQEGSSLPVTFVLHQNEPNPFEENTNIRFDLPRASDVQITLFDAQGRKVRSVMSGYVQPGYQAVTWDHRSDSGSPVRPGVYLYRLEAGRFRAQRKLVLLP